MKRVKLIKLIIKTSLSYILILCVIILFTLVGLPCALLPARYRYKNRVYSNLTYICAYLIIKAGFIRVHITGKEHLALLKNQPAIVVANHMSSFDIPLLEILVSGAPHIWFIKGSYQKIPIIGFILNRLNVMVNKAQASLIKMTIGRACDIASKNKNHIIMFPEGRRYADGTIHQFYSGFALLAQRLNYPVVPVVLYGPHKIFSKEHLLIDSTASNVKIVIGAPIYYNKTLDDKQDMVHEVRAWMSSVCDKLRE